MGDAAPSSPSTATREPHSSPGAAQSPYLAAQLWRKAEEPPGAQRWSDEGKAAASAETRVGPEHLHQGKRSRSQGGAGANCTKSSLRRSQGRAGEAAAQRQAGEKSGQVPKSAEARARKYSSSPTEEPGKAGGGGGGWRAGTLPHSSPNSTRESPPALRERLGMPREETSGGKCLEKVKEEKSKKGNVSSDQKS